MKNKIRENSDIKERVQKGLDLAFKKLVQLKRQTNGTFVFSQDGVIKKVKASDI